MFNSGWAAHGKALEAYYNGDHGAVVTVVEDDGETREFKLDVFFRDPEESDFDRAALALCAGRVLDAGAGAGALALALQSRGLDVTAIDVSPEAVEIMKTRGVKNVLKADIFTFKPEKTFDTVLLMMQGIGIAGTMDGLARFLVHARSLLNPGGRIVLDSVDFRDESDLPDPAASLPYPGEIRFTVKFGETAGEVAYLHVDPEALAAAARERGWTCRTVRTEEDGSYLAVLEDD